MKRFGVILMGIIAWGFLVTPTISLAQTHSLHTGVHAKSPFDAPKAKKSLHCELLKHQHSAKPFCPHTKHIRNMETQLKSDCGDSHNSALIQIQWSKTLMHCPAVENNSSPDKTSVFIPERLFVPSSYTEQPDKPPKHA